MSDDLGIQGTGIGQDDTGSQGTNQGAQDGGDGGQQAQAAPSFRDSLPEAIRDHEALKDIGDGPALAQKYLDLVQAAPVVPDSPEAYQIPLGEKTPVNPEAVKGFRAAAHKAGLTQAQVQEIGTFWDGFVQSQVETERAMVEKEIGGLKKEWGANFEANVEVSRKALAKFGSPGLVEHLEKTGLGNHPEMVKLFHNLGTAISEDSIATGQNFGTGTIKRTVGGEPLISFPSMAK
jgi:hypothetical protein